VAELTPESRLIVIELFREVGRPLVNYDLCTTRPAGQGFPQRVRFTWLYNRLPREVNSNVEHWLETMWTRSRLIVHTAAKPAGWPVENRAGNFGSFYDRPVNGKAFPALIQRLQSYMLRLPGGNEVKRLA
jgi:hypothetical protein